jgi:hypothetical protein
MSITDIYGFALKIAGQELPTASNDQISSIAVDSRIDQLARATIVVNILDTQKMELDRALIDTFAVGSTITIALGHDAPYSEVFSGEITGAEVRLAVNSQLVVSCRCPAVALLRAQAGAVVAAEANTAAAITAEAAVKKLVAAAGLSPDVSGLEGGLPHALQWWGDGWNCIRHLAQRAGCVTYFSKGKLHIGKPALSGAVLATLTWGGGSAPPRLRDRYPSPSEVGARAGTRCQACRQRQWRSGALSQRRTAGGQAQQCAG